MFMSPIISDESFGSPVANGPVVDGPTRLRLRKHQRSVSALSKAVASALGMDEARCLHIASAAEWHDVGKIYIPNNIINDSHPINRNDLIELQKHTIYGYNHLKGFKGDPVASLAAKIALQHHEKWDGTGYPFSLSGDEISIESRIVTLCDVYDALREDRPYRYSMNHEDAMHVLIFGDNRTKPSMFDPKILHIAAMIHGEFRNIFEREHRREGEQRASSRH